MKIKPVMSGASLPLFLVAIVFRSSKWKTFRTASGSPEELQRQHAHLTASGCRCRLRAEEGPGASADARMQTALQVHEDDLKQAAEALARYERERCAEPVAAACLVEAGRFAADRSR